MNLSAHRTDYSAWLETRANSLILAIALIFGAALRFLRLGAREMSADEGASWAAAAAPTVADVWRLQARFNPGKLALHDLALHTWIGAFGDGLAAMRAMSAALGTLAIAMVYLVSRELMLMSMGSRAGDENQRADAAGVAALTALLFALSSVPIGYSREARMYPILLVAILAQVWFLLRAARVGGIRNYAGVCIFTALAVAAHFSAACVLASEGLWLLYILASSRRPGDARDARDTPRRVRLYSLAGQSAAWKLAASLALGITITVPVMRGAMHASAAAIGAGAINWIRPPTIWESLTIFRGGTGIFILPMIAAIGALLGLRWAPGAVLFALIWMWVPVGLQLLVSYTLTPLLVERYVLSSFVPFYLLIALAVCSASTPRTRWAGFALVTILALGQDVRFFAHQHNDANWREAAKIASSSAAPGQPIAVVPAYAVNVVRYYVAPEKRPEVVATPESSQGVVKPSVVIVFDQGLPSSKAAALNQAYPDVVAHLRRLTVMRR
ncbi:MAG: hypothetical protein ABSD31_04035 [Candidatus Binataceae bacterium]